MYFLLKKSFFLGDMLIFRGVFTKEVTCDTKKFHTNGRCLVMFEEPCPVEGFNPSEKYWSNWIISLGRGEQIEYTPEI